MDSLRPVELERTSMRACVLYGARTLEVREVERPVPAAGDVLVRVEAVGLCGTDVHIFAGEANYNTDALGRPIPLERQPQILGHEITGRVLAVGSQVTALHPGDRVVLDQGLNCKSRGRSVVCEYCQSGDSHQCELYAEHGITGLPGGLAELIAVPAVNAVRVQSQLAPAYAALTEPLGCVIHALDALGRASAAKWSLGAPERERRTRAVLVFGAGPAGLLFVQYLRRVAGFDGLLLVSEPNATKRALAQALGAHTVDPRSNDLAAVVAERTAGRRVELAVDASGAGQVFASIPGVLRKQGSLVLYGHGHVDAELRALNAVQFLEPTVICPCGASGGFEADGRPSTYVRALELLEAGTIDVAPFVTHRYTSLDAVASALMHDWHSADYVKGVVELPAG